MSEPAADAHRASGARDEPARLREFVYRPSGPARGARPGHHRSRGGEQGLEFRGHARLIDAPDARRLDVLASLRDPLALDHGQWLVKQHAQPRAIDVALVADLSASMRSGGALDRRAVLADFTQALAWSAWKMGDRFAFVGCDEAVRPEWQLPPSRAAGVGVALADRLRHWPGDAARGRSADGLARAAAALPTRRTLVFVASDWHFDDALTQRVLASFAAHDVVPVVLWHPHEFEPLHDAEAARRGVVALRDPEGGAPRLLWWRASLRARVQAAGAARRATLETLFRTQGLRPLFIEGAFDADAVTRHFQQ